MGRASRPRARTGTGGTRSAWVRYLTSHPGVCAGQLCARGTRVPVAVLLDELAEGATLTELRRAHPALTAAHVTAALRYAAELARTEESVPFDILATNRRALRAWARANPF